MHDVALEQLKDIHLPKAISMWQIAPGWVILWLLFLLILGSSFYIWYKRNRKKLAIRFALKQLEQIKQLLVCNPDNINIAAEVATLLKRTALYYFAREEIAALTGEKWLAFLNASSKTTLFTPEVAGLLTDAPFQKENHPDLDLLFNTAHQWLKQMAKVVEK